jgi:hypothetical protein
VTLCGKAVFFKLALSIVFLIFGTIAVSAQDVAAVWQQLALTPFDPEKSASVENLVIARDRIHITLTAGTIQFTKPAQDLVYGAAFLGKGRVEIKPPNQIEARQLRMFTGQEALVMNFTEATFTFSDAFFDEISKQVHWRTHSDNSLKDLFLRRWEEHQNASMPDAPRIFKSIFSDDRKRTAFFAADLKTEDKGWVSMNVDALATEEVGVGRLVSPGSTVMFENWLSFPVGDRSAADANADPMAREDIDIKKYKIEAKVTGSEELTATSEVMLEEKSNGERVLIFQLDANLRVESVKNKGGKTLDFFQPRDPKDRAQSYGDYVAVVLPAPSKDGMVETLEFRYGGKRVIRRVGDGNFFCQSFGWYPTLRDVFATRAHFDFIFRNPKQFTLVATGDKISESSEGDWKVTSWKSSQPLSVAGFAFGKYKLYAEKSGNVAIEAYANTEADDTMQQIRKIAENAPIGTLSPVGMIKSMGTELGNMVRLFEAYYGLYPYNRLAVTNIPYSYGQGWPSLIYLSVPSFLDSTQRNVFGIHGDENIELTDFFRAHETSHQWWGHRVGWKSYHDEWLSEGLAQFSGNLYVQYRRSEKEYLNRIKEDKEELLGKDKKGRVYESLGPIWMGQRLESSDTPDAYSIVVYKKGGLVVNAIRRMLWNPQGKNSDDRFIKMMKDYCQTFNNKAASTEDFKAILEKYMVPIMDLEGNQRMDWFFRQYVYGTGVPEYRMQYQIEDAGGGQFKIRGKILQSAVPDGWLDVLVLYGQVSGKVSRLGLLSAKGKETPFEFNLPLEPEKLLLNHQEDTIANIR